MFVVKLYFCVYNLVIVVAAVVVVGGGWWWAVALLVGAIDIMV